MTETQNTKNHRAPLARGEIRTHTVGTPDTPGGWRTFKVMHVAGGSFTQASVSRFGKPTEVISTDPDARVAVNAYADAIEQAESDALDTDPMDDENLPMGASRTLVTGETNMAGVNPAADPAWVAARDRASRMSPAEADAFYTELETQQADQHTGCETPAAPSLADDIAWLHKHAHVDEGPRYSLTQVLDRIAAQMPQRAMFDGRPVWQHACGAVKYGNGFPDGCSWCYKPGAWQSLYTLGGE